MSSSRRPVLIVTAFLALAAVALWQMLSASRAVSPKTLKGFMKREVGPGLGALKDAAQAGMGPEAAFAAQDLLDHVERINDFASATLRATEDFKRSAARMEDVLREYAAFASRSSGPELAARYPAVKQACSDCHAAVNRGKPF